MEFSSDSIWSLLFFLIRFNYCFIHVACYGFNISLDLILVGHRFLEIYLFF